MPNLGNVLGELNLGALSEPMWAADRARRMGEVFREKLRAMNMEPDNVAHRWSPLLPRHEFEIMMKYPESREILRNLRNYWLGVNQQQQQQPVQRQERVYDANYNDLTSLDVPQLQVLRDYIIRKQVMTSTQPVILFGLAWPMPVTFVEVQKLLRYRAYNVR